MSSSTKHVLTDGRLIAYKLSSPRRDGESTLPTIILSNSLAAPYASWEHVVQVLLEHGYGVLQYDQPGHGETSVPSDLNVTTFESMADDVASLLKGLKITKLKAWIGVSMGAAKGIYFTVRHPGIVQNLIVCDTISSSPKVAGVADVFGPRAEMVQKEGSMSAMNDATLKRWFSETWRQENPSRLEEVRSIMESTQVEGFVTCIRALQSETFDLKPLARKIGGVCDNVLLVVGELDANVPQTMDELRSQIEGGFQSAGKSNEVELKVIKNAGHVSYIDGFDEFCRVITEFLAER